MTIQWAQGCFKSPSHSHPSEPWLCPLWGTQMHLRTCFIKHRARCDSDPFPPWEPGLGCHMSGAGRPHEEPLDCRSVRWGWQHVSWDLGTACVPPGGAGPSPWAQG